MHSLTNIEPGSEMPGVPASEIKEISDPWLINFIILTTFLFSLNLWLAIKFDLIWYFSNKFLEILVSSHKM